VKEGVERRRLVGETKIPVVERKTEVRGENTSGLREKELLEKQKYELERERSSREAKRERRVEETKILAVERKKEVRGENTSWREKEGVEKQKYEM